MTERQKDLEMKTQQLEVKLSNKTEEEIKKARRKSTQAGEYLCPSAHSKSQVESIHVVLVFNIVKTKSKWTILQICMVLNPQKKQA